MQRKVDVAFTLGVPDESTAPVLKVSVKDRVYPTPSNILGEKSTTDDARLHSTGWDLYKLAWEKRFVTDTPMTVTEVAAALETLLGGTNTVRPRKESIERAYAVYITKQAQEMTVMYGDSSANSTDGVQYKNTKKKYVASHEKKHDGKLRGGAVTKHKNLKRKTMTHSRQLLTPTVEDHLKKNEGYDSDECKRVNKRIRLEHMERFEEAYDTSEDEDFRKS